MIEIPLLVDLYSNLLYSWSDEAGTQKERKGHELTATLC